MGCLACIQHSNRVFACVHRRGTALLQRQLELQSMLLGVHQRCQRVSEYECVWECRGSGFQCSACWSCMPCWQAAAASCGSPSIWSSRCCRPPAPILRWRPPWCSCCRCPYPALCCPHPALTLPCGTSSWPFACTYLALCLFTHGLLSGELEMPCAASVLLGWLLLQHQMCSCVHDQQDAAK